MTYQNMAAPAISSAESIYFVGPGAIFSRVALRTVETELDGPTHRVPDLDALRFARMSETGTVKPAYMVVAHESCAHALLGALEQGAEFLPRHRLAIAFENETTASALLCDICDALVQRHVSLLPMDTNVTNWIRLLQVIQAGGHYVPPELMQARAPQAESGADRLADTTGADTDSTATTGTGASGATRSANGTRAAFAVQAGAAQTPAQTPAQTHAQTHAQAPAPDGLTPRESEVLAMAASGSPNKMIASELELSEHTVKLYMHRVIGKLGVRNRTEAAIWYHQHGQNA